MGIGKRNERNAENKGARIGIRMQGISVGMWGIWVEMQKMWGIRVAMKGIKVEA